MTIRNNIGGTPCRTIGSTNWALLVNSWEIGGTLRNTAGGTLRNTAGGTPRHTTGGATSRTLRGTIGRTPAAVIAALALGLMSLSLSLPAQSAPERDCVLEGHIKSQSSNADKVYVAFHSARPAEQGAHCRLRRNEKLRFRAPTGSNIQQAAPGSKVEYRYTEHGDREPTWELRGISS